MNPLQDVGLKSSITVKYKCRQKYIYIDIYRYLCIYIYTHVYIDVYVYVCVYTYIFTHTCQTPTIGRNDHVEGGLYSSALGLKATNPRKALLCLFLGSERLLSP